MSTILELHRYRTELVDVMQAYADCWMKHEDNWWDVRNLNFRCKRGYNLGFVPMDTAMHILFMAGVTKYNDFDNGCLHQFDERNTVCIAREGSVALYVKRFSPDTQMPSAKDVKADEMNLVDGEENVYRYWWD